MPTKETEATSVDWWITSGPLDGTGGRPRGQKILGPFVSQALAIKVRTYVEKDSNGRTFWICPESEATHA